ncbi:MAG: metal-dependent hydrolase [Thaumarchaeota archaeon]|nr:metal-dependent hydrolase [Nitrososphaerota archaeon]
MGALFGRLGLVQIAGLVLLYSLLSFLWSLIGFVSPAAPEQYYAVGFPSLAVEILGHFLFGVVAGLATRSVGLAVLCGGEAVLIDSDHFLSTLNLPVLARLSHSIPFAITIAVVFLLLPQHLVRRKTLALVTIASILSHLSFDIFAGDGQFPLIAPFSFQSYDFPYFYWPVFEVVAIVFCALVVTRHQTRR